MVLILENFDPKILIFIFFWSNGQPDVFFYQPKKEYFTQYFVQSSKMVILKRFVYGDEW